MFYVTHIKQITLVQYYHVHGYTINYFSIVNLSSMKDQRVKDVGKFSNNYTYHWLPDMALFYS